MIDELLSETAKGRNWISAEPVNKGWSSDRKYRIGTLSGETLLLRLSDAEKYEEKRREYEVIGRFSKLGFNMSVPIEFGRLDGRVYMLLSWVEGEDLETTLPRLTEREQYLLGREAGRILKTMHSVPLRPEETPVRTKKEKKLDQLKRYELSSLRIPGDETAVEYVKENIDLIWREPPVCQHGDFHPGNLIYSDDGSLGVIDFNRWEIGDPYEEFYKLESFGTEASIPYCIGQIDAYFEDRIPEDFWRTNAVYVAHASLYSIKWAEKFGEAEIAGMTARAKRAFEDFDGFRLTVPKWYTDKYRKNGNPSSRSCVI